MCCLLGFVVFLHFGHRAFELRSIGHSVVVIHTHTHLHTHTHTHIHIYTYVTLVIDTHTHTHFFFLLVRLFVCCWYCCTTIYTKTILFLQPTTIINAPQFIVLTLSCCCQGTTSLGSSTNKAVLSTQALPQSKSVDPLDQERQHLRQK